jgi:hypothetical protein
MGLGELKHGKNMRCKHAFRPISAGFAAIQLGMQGSDQLILYPFFYFHKFFNFCQTNFVYKESAPLDRAVSAAKSRTLYAGKYGTPELMAGSAPNFYHRGISIKGT